MITFIIRRKTIKKRPKTRRIKKELQEFFKNQELTEWESAFIIGCINAQNKFPQLTSRQWDLICGIENKLRNKENPDG